LAAITTPFREDLTVDHELLARHAAWLLEAGCDGLVALGSLGEGGTLSSAEKRAVLETCVRTASARKPRLPVVAGVASMTTREAADLARTAADAGCEGLMVLPPYVYRGDWRETRAHFEAVIRATRLSCMLYNNPIAYGTDIAPHEVAELAAALPNLNAVKESSADVRRITAIRALAGERLAIAVGVDELIVEGIAAGATGWIAGLVNAWPRESVELFDGAMRGKDTAARGLYEWFLPLLRMDTVPKFVQLIKLAQQEVGMGNERVRPPRLPLAGEERERALATIREALRTRLT
jgi:4-hydroxy-tetrahydrodipicolinate synthase